MFMGLAGRHLGKILNFPFDEIYGAEASRSFVYSKLYEARLKSNKNGFLILILRKNAFI
jgi:DNA-directed RNA polymerase subunit beta